MAEKKKGFFGRLFGGRKKEEKAAEDVANEAAKRAEAQARVDAEMAAKMAAINAAALKAARENDLREAGIEPESEDTSAIEEEERKRAEEQARRDVEAAKKLAEEKRAKELEAKRVAEEEAAFKKAEAERLEREVKQAVQLEDKLKAEEAKRKREEEARIKAAADSKEKERLKLEAEAAEKAAKENAEIERQAAREEAERLAELERRKEEAIREAARQAEEEAKARAVKEAEDARIAAELEAKRAEEQVTGDSAYSTQPVKAKEVKEREGGFLSRITRGLSKSTSQMSKSMAEMFTKRKLDDEALEDLEDLLIAADLGVGPASKVSQKLAKDRFDKQVTDTEIKIALADVISEILTPLEKPMTLTGAKPEIILFVGVNGSGKTTTLGKMAKKYADQGKKILIVAGDTFRAAADAQLKIWGERAGAPVMSAQKDGADAAGLVYDAIERAKSENYDLLMIDTAGRLQNRTELMDELAKIVRIIKKHDETAPHHSILVLDATVGQNALVQTEAFAKTAGVTGLVMTKLDGTAKGGVLVALSDKFGLPIHAIGIGERIEDLENFSAPVFAAALSGVAAELEV